MCGGLASSMSNDCPSASLTFPSANNGDKNPGIYVHIPFCRRICPYCDFAVRRDHPERKAGFVDRLSAELERVDWCGPQDFDTVYFGGGTPSTLSPSELDRVVAAIQRRFDCRDNLQVCLEVNPEDVNRQVLAEWQQLGVQFLSVGVQALDDRRLHFLGREHSARQAIDAIESAQAAGFGTVSVDLIYGHKDHDVADWLSELQRVVALGVDHLSCYSLTVSPNTVFGKAAQAGERLLPGEELQAEFFFTTHRMLGGLGLAAYEISNFARTSADRSAHNRKYWLGVPYLGVGPSAHSFDGQRRWWNLPHEAVWAKSVDQGQSPVEETEILEPEQRLTEVLMLGLRTADGVDLQQLKEQFSVDIVRRSRDYIETLVDQGLAIYHGSRLSLTVQGWAVADAITAGF